MYLVKPVIKIYITVEKTKGRYLFTIYLRLKLLKQIILQTQDVDWLIFLKLEM